MFRNFLVLAFRNFKKSPLTSFIELFGMTASLTVFSLILLWVFHETSFDKFNIKSEQIYRLETSDDSNDRSALIPSIISPLLNDNLLKIENSARFRVMGGKGSVQLLEDKGTDIKFDSGPNIYADNAIFDIFSFDFIAGNPKDALNRKNTVVITESLAGAIFGDKPVIGEVLYREKKDYEITGVIKDIPNFHIPFKMLMSFDSLEEIYLNVGLEGLDIWGFAYHSTYLLLNSNQNITQLETEISQLVDKHHPENYKIRRPNLKFYLRPLKEVYFKGGEATEMGYANHGDKKKVIAYSSIALFMLFLACINFVNLNSAKSLERAREVGIKKVAGATRFSIFIQFLGEVFILCILSMLLSLVLTYVLLPRFNDLLSTNIDMHQLFNVKVIVSMLTGLILIGLASGGFPALFMSSFRPAIVIKGLPVGSTRGFSFRKYSLAIQFALTIILIIGSITVGHQVNFMKNADLGFGKEHRIVFPLNIELYGDKIDVIKRRLLSNPNIMNVSHSNAVPGRNSIADQESWKMTFDGKDYQITTAFIDEDYFETIGVELLTGRFLEKNRPDDEVRRNSDQKIVNVILNQKAIKTLGINDPIGAVIKTVLGNIRVVGVVKDFHLNDLNNPILPMVFINIDIRYQMIANISSANIASTLQFIRLEVKNLTENKVDVKFLDEEFNRQYGKDDNFAELIRYLTLLAILIASLGLYGVAEHSIKLRLKEIGVRKTLGASTSQILKLLLIYFLRILFFSILIAVPIAWFTMENWLNGFPYHAELSTWIFIIGGSLAVFIAIATVIGKSWHASAQNPVKLIKYE